MNSSAPIGSGRGEPPSRFKQNFNSRWSVEKLGKPFWVFFAAAFFFDFGFDLYFFLYNLFLLSLHYNERAIGIITSALTVGNVAGSIPASMLARRFGLRRALLICFTAAPILSVCRTTTLWMPAQVVLAFLTGLALSSWPVCFAPTIASVTTKETRVFAFSVTFATGIGTGVLAGLAGGYIPALFHTTTNLHPVANGMRLVLIAASLIAVIGAWPVSKLKISFPSTSSGRKLFVFHPFLLRFLPAFTIWSIVTGSFIPFVPIFFQKQLGISLQHVGVIFSASELVQFVAVLLIPFLYRRVGVTAGILIAQLVTGGAAFILGRAHSVPQAVACYLLFAGAQFAAGPGFYGMLMSRLPESDRSSASAIQNISGALSQAGASTLTGMMIVQFGYGPVFNGNAAVAVCAALLLVTSLRDLDGITRDSNVKHVAGISMPDPDTPPAG
jgi:MFS family permease